MNYEEMSREKLIETLKKRDKQIDGLGFKGLRMMDEIAELEYKIEGLRDVRWSLLEAESDANEMDRENVDSRAYDVWHTLRFAVADIGKLLGIDAIRVTREVG